MRTAIVFSGTVIAKAINMNLISDYSFMFKSVILVAIVADLYVQFEKEIKK